MSDENVTGAYVPRQTGSVPLPADAVSAERAIRDLISDVTASKGRWFGRITPLVRRKDKLGCWVITYSFESTEHHSNSEATGHAPLPAAERVAAEAAMRDIEKVANIRFQRAMHVDLKQRADLRFFEVESKAGREWGGQAENTTSERDVLINKRGREAGGLEVGGRRYGLIVHEMLHALGLSHPGANGKGGRSGGDNPAYTTDGTIMSYNPGHLPEGLGPYDVLALQDLYGMPGLSSRRRPLVSGDELTRTTVLYSEAGKPFSLDFRGSSLGTDHPAFLWVDLASHNFGHQIVGRILDSPAAGKFRIGVRLVPGTRVKDVLAGKGTKVTLLVDGNDLPNILQGGDQADELRPRGGHDVLTGNGGGDRFILDAESGRENRITDFSPTEDKIAFRGLKSVELRRTADGRGTDVICKNDDNYIVASIEVTNEHGTLGPQQVEGAIERRDPRDARFDVKVVPDLPRGRANATHPSGLPGGAGLRRTDMGPRR